MSRNIELKRLITKRGFQVSSDVSDRITWNFLEVFYRTISGDDASPSSLFEWVVM